MPQLNENQSFRRTAGSFSRKQLTTRALKAMLGVGAAMGVVFAIILDFVLSFWVDDGLLIWIELLIAALLMTIISLVMNSSTRWNLDNWRKGLYGETRVAQTIEYALAAPNCAVAHSVTSIAKVGDIDHLIATPEGIWVIETKYSKVRLKYFPSVLRSIAANTKSVRKQSWVPEGIKVRGGLVLAFDSKFRKRNYSEASEDIRVFTPKLLQTELRKEARSEMCLDREIAEKIWDLGYIDES